jgi:hypothetical protein
MENPEIIGDTAMIIAVVSTIAFLLYMLVSGVSDITHHGATDASHGDGWSVLQFISIQSVLLGTMSFSWSWIYWSTHFTSGWVQILGTLVCGCGLTYMYLGGLKLVSKLNSSDKVYDFIPAVGAHAHVYLCIPAAGEGFGIVTVADPATGSYQFNAVTDATDKISTGSQVVITEVNLPSNVKVRLV